jgi:hypothetical protein
MNQSRQSLTHRRCRRALLLPKKVWSVLLGLLLPKVIGDLWLGLLLPKGVWSLLLGLVLLKALWHLLLGSDENPYQLWRKIFVAYLKEEDKIFWDTDGLYSGTT